MCLASSDGTARTTFCAPSPSIIVNNRRAATSTSATWNSPSATPARTMSAMQSNHSPVSSLASAASGALRRPRLHASSHSALASSLESSST